MDKKGERAFINGKIFTANKEAKYADSMIVKEGKISWIGEYADMPAFDGEVVDLNGKRVLPGFIDSHMHPVMLADYAKKISCLPPVINSIEELIEEIKKAAEAGDKKWIEGWGYDEGKFAERRSPNRYDLDRGCSTKPVYLVRTCLHMCCVNSKALELAGIDKNTPDPEGGHIERDEKGEPTGVLKENARYLVTKLIPQDTFEKTVDNIVDLGELLLSQGVTSVADMGVFDDSDSFEFYEAAQSKGFKQRVGIYQMWDTVKDKEHFTIPKERFNKENKIHQVGLKLIGDGSISGHTAWVEEPFLGTDDCGIQVCSDEDFESALAYCKAHHCQMSIHAMGGRAIDRVVNRLYKEDNWMDGTVPKVRMEHITEPSEAAVKKVAEKGFGFSIQPIFLYSEIESYLTNLGLERTQKTYPIKHLLDENVILSISTDSPATSWAVPSDPLPNIKCSVTRKAYDGTPCGIDQAIDIETAIELYTRNGAILTGFSKVGELREGYSADFIVIDKDILEIDPEDIISISVEETYIDGDKVYENVV